MAGPICFDFVGATDDQSHRKNGHHGSRKSTWGFKAQREAIDQDAFDHFRHFSPDLFSIIPGQAGKY